jgi:hypothetical protein
MSEESKSRIAAGNRCFYSLGLLFRSRALSKAVKIEMYKMMVKTVVVYGIETWPMTEMNLKRLSAWEGKILRWIYGPVIEQGIWRIRTNQELRELCKDVDVVADVKKNSSEWIRHRVRVDHGRVVKIYESKLE